MKKIVLIISGILAITSLTLDRIGTFRLCGGIEYGHCMDVLSGIILLFFPILPLFFFSLVTYFMRDEVFQSWWRFARVWVPVSMIAILLAPAYASDWMFPVDKGRIAFFTSLLFMIISLILIIRTKWKLQK